MSFVPNKQELFVYHLLLWATMAAHMTMFIHVALIATSRASLITSFQLPLEGEIVLLVKSCRNASTWIHTRIVGNIQYKSNKSLRSVLELRSFYGATVPKKTIGTRPTEA